MSDDLIDHDQFMWTFPIAAAVNKSTGKPLFIESADGLDEALVLFTDEDCFERYCDKNLFAPIICKEVSTIVNLLENVVADYGTTCVIMDPLKGKRSERAILIQIMLEALRGGEYDE